MSIDIDIQALSWSDYANNKELLERLKHDVIDNWYCLVDTTSGEVVLSSNSELETYLNDLKGL